MQDSAWQCRTVLGNAGQRLAMQDSAWQCRTVFGKYRTVQGNA
jgi:hypothetical protein